MTHQDSDDAFMTGRRGSGGQGNNQFQDDTNGLQQTVEYDSIGAQMLAERFHKTWAQDPRRLGRELVSLEELAYTDDNRVLTHVRYHTNPGRRMSRFLQGLSRIVEE